MRRITIPAVDWRTISTRKVSVPVLVDWPELRLSDDEIAANAAASVAGRPEPYPNRALFEIVLERPPGA
jgi:hypothetical protein